MNKYEYILEYVCKLPPPSYIYGKYVDFLMPFVKEYYEDALKGKYMYFPKVEYGE